MEKSRLPDGRVRSGRSDLGGEQTCGPERTGMTAAPKSSPVRTSLHGVWRSADLVLTGGRPRSCGKKRARAPQELPGEGSKHAGKDAQRSRREGPAAQPWVVHTAKTPPRAAMHRGREATGLAHQAVVASMRRSCFASEGPVGTQRYRPVRRGRVIPGHTRCRRPWLGWAQTLAS